MKLPRLERCTPDGFWGMVNKTDSCWIWTSQRTSRGYGYAVISKGKRLLAHRVAYADAYGLVPEGLLIDHMCRNRACVRPDHLRATDQVVNMQNLSGAKTHSKTGVRGVWWDTKSASWQATVSANGHRYRRYGFKTIAEAGEVAAEMRTLLHASNPLDRQAV